MNTLVINLNNHMKANELSIAMVAKDLDLSRSTMSRYLSGKYPSGTAQIEDKIKEAYPFVCQQNDKPKEEINDFMNGANEIYEEFKKLEKSKRFYTSHDAQSIIGLCQSCQENSSLGIVVGRSGYGKTHSLKEYAKLSKVAYIECDDTMGQRDIIRAIECSLGIPRVQGSIWSHINTIRDFFNSNKGYLLIIDEADKLVSKYTQKKLEILRGIFDQSKVGLVIAGEPKLEVLIKNYIDRFANRIDFYHLLNGLSKNEAKEYLDNYPVDEEALNELINRACNKQNGCFRLLDRTMNNALRIANNTQSKIITLDTIHKSSSMMMI